MFVFSCFLGLSRSTVIPLGMKCPYWTLSRQRKTSHAVLTHLKDWKHPINGKSTQQQHFNKINIFQEWFKNASDQKKSRLWRKGVKSFGKHNKIDCENLEGFFAFCLSIPVCFRLSSPARFFRVFVDNGDDGKSFID